MAQNPYRNPRRRTASFPVDLDKISRKQAEINGTDKSLEYTGEKLEVTGPGIGVAGLKKRIHHG